MWNVAVHRVAVIGPLADADAVGHAAADAAPAAAELGVSKRHVYLMRRRWVRW